jgi:hypothetical protein
MKSSWLLINRQLTQVYDGAMLFGVDAHLRKC